MFDSKLNKSFCKFLTKTRPKKLIEISIEVVKDCKEQFVPDLIKLN